MHLYSRTGETVLLLSIQGYDVTLLVTRTQKSDHGTGAQAQTRRFALFFTTCITVRHDLLGKPRYFHVFYADARASYTDSDLERSSKKNSQLVGHTLRNNARLDAFAKCCIWKNKHAVRKGKSYPLRREEIRKRMDFKDHGAGAYGYIRFPGHCPSVLETYRDRDNSIML